MFAPKLFAAAAAILVMQAAAAAETPLFDAVSLDVASGTRTQMIRFSANAETDLKFFQSNGTHLGMYWESSVGAWRANHWRNVDGASESLVDIGITPVFRFQNDSKKGLYAELGIGYHLLSKLYNNDTYRLSTAFQFGDHVGIGYVFDNHWEFGAKIQHFSNGGIKHPNTGVNFLDLKASYHF
jgi:lipid A 3-O-deacylase